MPNVDIILKRFGQLSSMRGNWENLWADVAIHMWPDADDFITARSSGTRRTERLFENTALNALEKFASVLESLLTPRSEVWHRLRATDKNLNDDTDVKEWFDQVIEELFAQRNSPRANYYSQMHVSYKSLGAFGNQCMFVEELPEGGITYRNRHLGQIYIDTNHRSQVDTVFYRYPLSAKAAVQKWGDRTPEKVRRGLENQPFEPFEFLHVVLPRGDFDPGLDGPGGMPWAAYDVGIADKQVILDGGYNENPYLFSRYTLNPNENYGRSPAMMVLPSVKTLQEMEKVHLRAGHKVADPPLLLKDDDVLGGGSDDVKLMPGGLNWGGLDTQGREMIKPLMTGGQPGITIEMMNEKREAINDAFLVNLFQILVDKGQMTATEVLERAKEKGQMLAPMIGRQQAELLGPQIEREINILQRQGRLPPMPQVLIEAAGEYEIEYESPAMRLQSTDEVLGIVRAIEVVTPFAEVNPSVLKVFHEEKVARRVSHILGVPTDLLRDEEELAAEQEAEQQRAQVAQLAEQIPAAAGAAKDIAQTAQISGASPV